ncbi:MAG: hypothetical protein EKK48_12815 [Candidatus Melainabacteria bacterium]|nr:MAG: hypothetical protein EKK48_12815 [Candidatus Melainabacteria bacterium]
MKKRNKFFSLLLSSLLLASPSISAAAAGLGGFMPVVLIPRSGAFVIDSGAVDYVQQSKYIRHYDQIWQLVQRHFLYRNRLHNWGRWRHRFDEQLTSSEAMRAACDAMLASLNDPYTYYRDVSATSERQQEDLETNVVNYKFVSKNVGYIRLKTFCSKNCVGEMRNGMQQLHGARAIVMDLRDNKGGSVEDAFSIFSMFVRTGKFASMTGIDGKNVIKERLSVGKTKLFDKKGRSTKIRSREQNLSRARPLLVLVDGKTKSAAEMLAGALRDSAGAKIIGTKTYGKGVIQRVWEFDDQTSVKITSAAYKLPSGATIHGVGIKPAIKVAASNSDKQLQLATRLLRGTHNGRKVPVPIK